MALDDEEELPPDAEARTAGYGWDEIDNHVAQASSDALDEGYSSDEIRDFLGQSPPDAQETMNFASWKAHYAMNPDDHPQNNGGSLPDPTSMPAWRANYANSVANGHHDTPQQFADDWAAQAVKAGAMGLDDEAISDLAAQANGVSDTLAPLLPHPHDFTDAALALKDQGQSFDETRRNILDHWAETGQEPGQAVAQARQDADLYGKLTAGRPKDHTWLGDIGAAFGDVVFGAEQLLDKTPVIGDALNKAYDGLADLGLAPKQLPRAAAQQYEDQFIKARENVLKANGYDNWVRTGAQMLMTAPLALSFGLEGLGGAIATGATGGALSEALHPDTASDFWTQKGLDVASGLVTGGIGGGALHYAMPWIAPAFKALGGAISGMLPDATREFGKILPDLLEPKFKELNIGGEEGAPVVRDVTADEAHSIPKPAPTIYDINGVKASGDTPLGEVEARMRAGQAEGATGPIEMPVRQFDPDAEPHEIHAGLLKMFEDGELSPKPVKVLGGDDDPGFTTRLYQAAVEKGLIPEGDTAVKDLVGAHDAAASVGNDLLSMVTKSMKDLITDNSGALRIPRMTPGQRLRAAGAEKLEMNYSRDKLLEMMGNQNIGKNFVADNLNKSALAFKPHQAELEASLDPRTATQRPSQTVLGQFLQSVDKYVTGGVVNNKNNVLDAWGQTYAGMYDMVRRLEKAADADPANPYSLAEALKTHLQRHTAAINAPAAMEKFGISTKGKLENTVNAFPSLVDMMDKGVPFKTYDIHKLLIDDITSRLNLVQLGHTLKDMKVDGHIRTNKTALGGGAAEGGDVRIPDTIPFSRKVWVDPKTGKAGTTEMWANPTLVRNLTNTWGNGLYDNPGRAATALDWMTWFKNTSTMMKLTFPIFHAQVMMLGSIANSFGQGLESLSHGDLGDAAKQFGLGMSVVGAPRRQMRTGFRAALENKNLNTNDEVIQLLRAVNHNFGNNSLETGQAGRMGQRVPTLWDNVMAGRSAREYIADAFTGGDKTGLEGQWWKQQWQNTIGSSATELARERAQSGFGRLVHTTTEVTQHLMGSINQPLFDSAIPALKTGAAYERLQKWLERNRGASQEEKLRYAKQVSMDVDNRMGEMSLNNSFWNKSVAQWAQAGMLSTSWSYGTWRGFAAAMGRDIERGQWAWNPVSTYNTIGTGMALAYANSLWGLYQTGELPKSWHDLVSFRTGQDLGKIGDIGENAKRWAGTEQRAMLPTEWKELSDIGSIIANAWQSPGHAAVGTMDYMLGKLNPGLQAMRGIVTGHDPIGHEIWHQPGGIRRFLEDQLKPIFWNSGDARQFNTGISKLESFMGVREAPKWQENWDAYQEQMKGVNEQGSRGDSIKDQMKRGAHEVRGLESRPWWASEIDQYAKDHPKVTGLATERGAQQRQVNPGAPNQPGWFSRGMAAYKRDVAANPELANPVRAKNLGLGVSDYLKRARQGAQ